MANKTFRRVLSIIMCAAMLVSVFAVSFTASATVTTGDTEVTYDWDFTSADTAASDLAEMTGKSAYFNSASAASFTCADGYLKVAGSSTNFESAVFENPENYDLSSISVTAAYNAKVSNQVTQAGVVIGKTTYANGAVRIVKLSMSDMSYSHGFVRITDRNVNYDGNAFFEGRSLTLRTSDGADATKNYAKAFGVSASDFSKLTYKYDVTANDDNSVTVVVTITYDNTYTTTADPITIDLTTLQGYKDTITDFTPAFGVAKFYENQSNIADGGKLYKVTAVYKKGCTHDNQTTTPQIDATCTEAGKTAEVTCDDCGAPISGGETIDALGHEWGEWQEVTPATQDEEGLKRRICSRCKAVDQETLPPLDGSSIYNWNYADKNDGAAAYSATMEKVTFVNGGSTGNITYNSDEYYLEASSSNQMVGAVINTPQDSDGKDLVPARFIMTSPNNDDANRHYATAGAIIGYITLDEKQSPLYVNAASFNYGSADVSLIISNNVYSFDKRYYSEKLNLQKEDGTYSDDSYSNKHKYNTAFGFDISNANLKYLTYTYDVTVEDDAATVTVTITYNNPSDGKEYTTVAKPVTIDLAYINTHASNDGSAFSNVTAFTPAFGITRVISQYNVTSKVYKVWAKYAKGCDHENTHEEDEIPASCLEAGREAGTYCDDCGKFTSGGNVIAALGHDKETTVKTVAPSCQDGYTLYKCSRCDTEYKDDITAATGNHVKDEAVEPTVVPATCTEDGYTEYTCANCGEKFRDNATTKTGHGDWTWVVVKDPSETEDGNRRYVCGKCGYWNGTNVDIKAVNFAVESTQVVLDGSINFKITVVANTYFDQNSLKLTINGEEYTVNNGLKYDSASSDGNYARYTVTITKFAHQMTDKYDLKFEGTAEASEGAQFNQVLNCTDEKTDISVASNLANLYVNDDYSSYKTLIAKLANYGAAAQKYNALANDLGDIADTDLANYFLDDGDENKTTVENAYEAMTNTADGKFYDADKSIFGQTFKASLAIGLQTKIKMIVNVSNLTLEDGQSLWVRMGDVEQELENNNGAYSAAFGEFAPGDYTTDKTITLVVKNVDGDDVETSGEVTYSVGAYINRMAPKRDNLKPLLNAITEYYNAVKALS